MFADLIQSQLPIEPIVSLRNELTRSLTCTINCDLKTFLITIYHRRDAILFKNKHRCFRYGCKKFGIFQAISHLLKYLVIIENRRIISGVHE